MLIIFCFPETCNFDISAIWSMSLLNWWQIPISVISPEHLLIHLQCTRQNLIQFFKARLQKQTRRCSCLHVLLDVNSFSAFVLLSRQKISLSDTSDTFYLEFHNSQGKHKSYLPVCDAILPEIGMWLLAFLLSSAEEAEDSIARLTNTDKVLGLKFSNVAPCERLISRCVTSKNSDSEAASGLY